MCRMWFKCAIFLALYILKCHAHLIVNTPMGDIQGTMMKTRLGKDILAFRGVRYAKAPIGDLRFQPPVPITKYEGIYNATVDGPVCPQPVLSTPVSEDCLFLNIYTRSIGSLKRPVILHLHSGGFYSGGERSDWVGPQYFLDRDIVLVTMNYRLGSLGFISTGDKYAPGNNGLKDQVVAMKWVKKNIAAFGGDPNSVTIMGYSAGSWSVALHMVSPMSKGLFHKAIASSGSPLGIYNLPNHQLELAQKQARLMDCPDDSSEKIINCLKNKSAEEMGNTLPQFYEWANNPILIWSPTIEQDFGQQRFLPDHPINLIKKHGLTDIPFMTGITTDEFVYPAQTIFNNKTLLNELKDNWEKLAPISFIYERNTQKSKLISKKIKDFYFKPQITQETLKKAFADTITGYSVNKLIKLYSQYLTKPAYYYKFSYQGRYSHTYLSNSTIPAGVVHHDDLIYTLTIPALFPYFNTTDPEFEMATKLTSLYESFATTGEPSCDGIKWAPFTINDQQYLDINIPLKMKKDLFKERYDFWENLYPVDQI